MLGRDLPTTEVTGYRKGALPKKMVSEFLHYQGEFKELNKL
jgi:hypothetical protein